MSWKDGLQQSALRAQEIMDDLRKERDEAQRAMRAWQDRANVEIYLNAEHTKMWAEAALILGIDEDPDWKIRDVLDAIVGTGKTADLATTGVSTTGPGARPTWTETADLRGLQAKVAEQHRMIGALQDDVMSLRERLRKVEASNERVLEDA